MPDNKKAMLPTSVSALVDSFNELLPGIPWNDSIVDAIVWEIVANACCIRLPVYVVHGEAEVELEVHSRGEDMPALAKASVSWSVAEGLVWEGTRPATKQGLLELLLETRRVIKCLQHGPCATCAARNPPLYCLRLTPEGGCVSCVLTSFLQA